MLTFLNKNRLKTRNKYYQLQLFYSHKEQLLLCQLFNNYLSKGKGNPSFSIKTNSIKIIYFPG